MNEQFCQVGDIRLCYETFGRDEDPLVLLIMGLGTQMLGWHGDFCRAIADRGFRVVRFDNRDAGRSTHVRGRPPTPWQMLRRSPEGATYSLEDMAGDAAGLIEALDGRPAHVVGASMGGMIAQTLAASHPEHVRSLTSIMSTTGSRRAGQPALALYPIFLRRPPDDEDAYVEHTSKLFGKIGSIDSLRGDPDELREIARLSFRRRQDPAGTGRQLGAILAAGDRTAQLRTIRAPTLVIHGTGDRLVRPSGGRATAAAIPGARLVELDDMGHDLPPGLWPRIVDEIVGHARGAEDAARTSVAA